MHRPDVCRKSKPPNSVAGSPGRGKLIQRSAIAQGRSLPSLAVVQCLRGPRQPRIIFGSSVPTSHFIPIARADIPRHSPGMAAKAASVCRFASASVQKTGSSGSQLSANQMPPRSIPIASNHGADRARLLSRGEPGCRRLSNKAEFAVYFRLPRTGARARRKCRRENAFGFCVEWRRRDRRARSWIPP